MFGFGKVSGLNRAAYNDRVRNCLEGPLGIQTHRDKNPLFFSIFKSSDPVQAGWKLKLPPEETAMFIGLEYLTGAMRGSEANIAEAIYFQVPLGDYLDNIASLGIISGERKDDYLTGLSNVSIEARKNALVQKVIAKLWREE